MYIYYDSKTGNIERFVTKIKKERPEWNIIKIYPDLEIEKTGHLITFTTKIGEIPETTKYFLENKNNKKYIESVSSSGNVNWGKYFALAVDKINEFYGIPKFMKFELSGTKVDVEKFISYVEEKNE